MIKKTDMECKCGEFYEVKEIAENKEEQTIYVHIECPDPDCSSTGIAGVTYSDFELIDEEE